MKGKRNIFLNYFILLLLAHKGFSYDYVEDDDEDYYNEVDDDQPIVVDEQPNESNTVQPNLFPAYTTLTAAIGDSITFPCEINRNGSDSLTWKKDDEKVLMVDSVRITKDDRFEIVNHTSLLISGIDPRDVGMYSCELRTDPSTRQTHFLTLQSNDEGNGQFWGAPCPNMSAEWRDLGGPFCYVIELKDEVNWMDAVYRCNQKGGTLASFHFMEDIKRIRRLTKTLSDPLSIGLWKHSDGALEWVDESMYDFRNWKSEEPNDRSETCVEMFLNDGRWNDIPCSKNQGYICSHSKYDTPETKRNLVCPESSSKWKDLGGELCYIIEKDNEKTWEHAQRYCVEEGGHLASFHSIEEVSSILQHFGGFHNEVHIGLLQNADGGFDWVDKSLMDFHYWNVDEPNDLDYERCVEMIPGESGKFNDIPCTKRSAYICSTQKVAVGMSQIGTTEKSGDLVAEVSCGGDIESETGTIQTSTLRQYYEPNQSCLWRITVPENHQVSLRFPKFELEYGATCEFDYVKIYDGHRHHEGGVVLRTLCGSPGEEIIMSSGNKMAVKFVSDDKNEDVGFLGIFSTVVPCGGVITAEEGVIKSPNYPSAYWPNDRCNWKITVPNGFKVILKFRSFQLEKDVNCRFDYVEVLDGHEETSPVIGKFCDFTPLQIGSSGHKITVKFVSDFSKQYYGFYAEFQTDNTSITEAPPFLPDFSGSTDESQGQCGGDIFSERGVLVSPNYPKAYPPNEICTWRIIVPGHHRVALKFKTFQLESNTGCTYDFVRIADGHESTSTEIGNFCGGSTPSRVVSSGNVMSITFRSDSSNQYKGFSAYFGMDAITDSLPGPEIITEESCGENIVSDEGIVQSPNHPENYESNSRCAWRITVPDNYQVALKFLSFEVEKHDKCAYDYVEVYEGHLKLNRLLGKFCGDKIPEDILSSTNKMLVTFRSDSTGEYSGFSAEFIKVEVELPENETQVEEGSCGGDIVAKSGTVTSPNFPQAYKPLSECIWRITTEQDTIIALQFQSFDLEYDEDGCNFDNVLIFDGHSVDSEMGRLGKFCGEDIPELVRSSSNKVTIKFATDESFEKSGFKVNFTEVKTCGGSIIAENGKIQSPNYPSQYEPLQQCMWQITVPEDFRVSLKFLDFDLNNDDHSCKDFVTVFDGRGANNLISDALCGSSIPSRINSMDNTMTVMFESDAANQAKGFVAEFVKDMCGGEIVGEMGTLQSTNYLISEYPPLEKCHWNITVAENYQVVLRFKSFDTESSDNCNYDFVEIRDGHGRDAPLLGRYCGFRLLDEIRSTGNEMSVVFKTDSSIQKAGFAAGFTSGLRIPYEDELGNLLEQLPSLITSKKPLRSEQTSKPGLRKFLKSQGGIFKNL